MMTPTQKPTHPLIKFIPSSTRNITEEEVPCDDLKNLFKAISFLVTSEIKVRSSQRKSAINSRAQEVTKDKEIFICPDCET